MGRLLAVNVAVLHPDTGQPEVLVAGSLPPEWADGLLGDHVFVVEATEELAEDGPEGAPPKAGKGSGRGAWSDYAEERGVEVTEEMSRDDIIAAIEAASA